MSTMRNQFIYYLQTVSLISPVGYANGLIGDIELLLNLLRRKVAMKVGRETYPGTQAIADQTENCIDFSKVDMRER